MSASVQRVVDAATTAGLEIEVVEFPEGTRTAEAAAEAVGCQVDQIVKSMIFAAGDAREIVLALTSGSNKVDGTRLAKLAGVDACHRADPEEVRAASGFAIGGVAPIGHPNPLRTWIDPHLFDFDVIWAAAGTPRHVFAVDPVQLQELAEATKADFVT
jgi:prolyl-tRNA editing enzyme YbaK/EbsC (Cys-tRNA(Pro) deacylase)